jgi:hypothetical protein
MLQQIQEWMDALPGAVTIQKMNNGQVLVAIQSGTMSTMVIRKTFVEAAEACVQQMNCTARRSGR